MTMDWLQGMQALKFLLLHNMLVFVLGMKTEQIELENPV